VDLWTTAEVARHLKLSEDWVREHAVELGGIRINESKHSQLRFDPEAIAEWKSRRRLQSQRPASKKARPRRRRRPPVGGEPLQLPTRG
jgi:hypothetical protein